MSSVPFPLRLAAGVVATGIDTVRRLPTELPSWGVRLAGTAAKLALQVRNEITDLAIRGDELLEGSPAAQENPAWARFDDAEDEPPTVPSPTVRPSRTRASRVPAGGVGAEIGDESPGWSDPLTDAGSIAGSTAGGGPDGGPEGSAEAIIAGYGSLNLGQLRSRLTPMALESLRSLLDAEERAARRPAFLTLISNRIATLERTGS